MALSTNAGPLSIGVLLCDHVHPDLSHHVGGDYDDLFRAFLTAAASAADVDIDLRFYDAVNGILPASASECDAWVITGSQHDAFTDDEWIVNLRQFACDIVEGAGRIAGICFGHQIIATAFGGTVERTDQWSLGPQHLILEETPWFPATEVHLHALHRDAVTVLPPGARVIGAGTTAQIPAYQLGENVLCLQDHPEFPAPFLEAIIEARSDRIDADAATAAIAAINTQATDGPTIGEAIMRFLADQRR